MISLLNERQQKFLLAVAPKLEAEAIDCAWKLVTTGTPAIALLHSGFEINEHSEIQAAWQDMRLADFEKFADLGLLSIRPGVNSTRYVWNSEAVVRFIQKEMPLKPKS